MRIWRNELRKLTFYYTVNGYSRSCDVEVTATYQEAIEYEAIDLALPSGTLWANMNIGAKQPEGRGEFFQWGDIVGHSNTADRLSYANYKFGSSWDAMTKYNKADGLSVLEDADDACVLNMGDDWVMPTIEDVNELIDNCSVTSTTRNNIPVLIFTSNNNGNSLILPFYNVLASNYPVVLQDLAYWTKSLRTDLNRSDLAYYLYQNGTASSIQRDSTTGRYNGCQIRGVKK